MSKNKKSKRQLKSIELAAQAGAANEIVARYGSAATEYVIALTGENHATGQVLKRGLKKTAKSHVNPDYAKQNIRQQAGYAAEDLYVANTNADNIISGKTHRISRTDDIGRVNDPLFDHVQLTSKGIEIPCSGEQMKFVGSNPKACLLKLESEKFQKYLDADATITVPSDYYEGLLKEADIKISQLQKQLEHAKQCKDHNLEESIKKRIEKVKKIKHSVKDSGISNQEALAARTHPELITSKKIAKVANAAGVKHASIGARISGSISLIKNVVAVVKGDKETKDAAVDVVKDIGKGATMAYSTAFAGSVVKSGMQNAKNSTIRSLSKSNAPSAIVSSIIDITSSLHGYIKGDITGIDCLEQIGEKGVSNISAAMFTIAGQMVIPVPVIGGMVGSIVGYALSSTLYSELTTSLKEAKIAHEKRIQVEQECNEAIKLIDLYRKEMDRIVSEYFKNFEMICNEAFHLIDEAVLTDDINKAIAGINIITESLGGSVPYSSMSEFTDFMKSKKPLNI